MKMGVSLLTYIETKKLYTLLRKGYPSSKREIGLTLHIYEVLHSEYFDKYPEGVISILYDIIQHVQKELPTPVTLAEVHEMAIIVSHIYKAHTTQPATFIFDRCVKKIKAHFDIGKEV